MTHQPLFTALNPYSTFALLCILDPIEVVRDPHGDTHLAAIEAACQSKLDVALEDE